MNAPKRDGKVEQSARTHQRRVSWRTPTGDGPADQAAATHGRDEDAALTPTAPPSQTPAVAGTPNLGTQCAAEPDPVAEPSLDATAATQADPSAPAPAHEQQPRPRSARVDQALAVAATAALSPAIAARAAIAYASTGRVFNTHDRLGRGLSPITLRSFAGGAPGRRLPFLASVVRGDVRLIGPRPLHPHDWEARSRRDRDVTPGLVSRGRLRARLGIDYDPEGERDDQRVYTRDALALSARYAVAEVLGDTHLATPAQFTQLDLPITNTTMEEALDWCVERASNRPPSFLAFANADCLNQLVENPEYAAAMRSANRVLPDGIGVKLGARFQKVSVLANVNGTDLFPRLCERAADAGLRLFLLGARPGIAQAVADSMQEKYAHLQIAGTRHGYFSPEEEPEVVAQINAAQADIVLVAFGVPRQEEWIHTHLGQLNIGLALGVGGLFDFYSGRIPRAPQWVREIGLEWVWRLAQEPGRMWRRYVVGNPVFLWRAWRDARRREPAITEPVERPLLDYRDEYPQDYPSDSTETDS